MNHSLKRTYRLGDLILVLGLVLTLSFTLGVAPGGKGGGGKPPKDPPPPPPTTGMPDAVVVYTDWNAGDIYLTDGTDFVTLYNQSAVVRCEFSSDNTRISFWDDLGSGPGLYWIYIDGSSSAPTFITSSNDSVGYHTWGRSLAGEEYILFRDDGVDAPDIYAVKPDGTGRVNLTNTPGIWEGGNNLAWSNSGQYFITMSDADSTNHLWELDASMNVINEQSYTPWGGHMQFSADDQWIVAGSQYFGTLEVIKYEFANPANIIQMSDMAGWEQAIGGGSLELKEGPGVVGDDLIFPIQRYGQRRKDNFYKLFRISFTDGSGFAEYLPADSNDQRWPGFRRPSGSSAMMGRQASVEFSSIKPLVSNSPRSRGPADAADLLALLGAWGNCPPPCPQADFNRDGAVDLDDLLMFLNPATRPARW